MILYRKHWLRTYGCEVCRQLAPLLRELDPLSLAMTSCQVGVVWSHNSPIHNIQFRRSPLYGPEKSVISCADEGTGAFDARLLPR
jgi:hypothetical protein